MSGPYPYAGAIIIDPSTNAPGPGATVSLYDPLDTAYATPQEITDAFGLSLGTTLTAGAGGWSGKFNHATLPILNAKAGDPGDMTQPPFELISGAGIIESSAAAVASAAAAQVAAQEAAASAALSAAGVTAPTDAVIAANVSTPTTDTHAALVTLIETTAGTDALAMHLAQTATLTGVVTFSQAPVLPADALPISRVAGLQTALDAAPTDADLATKTATVVGPGMVTSHRIVLVASAADYPANVPGGGLPGDQVKVLVV